LPFFAENEHELFKSIQNDEPMLEGMSDNLKSLLGLMMEKDPEKRITIKEILEHPWMNEPPPLEIFS
jgi:[calcium/calmodulin-dependent protein kinase] kinase